MIEQQGERLEENLTSGQRAHHVCTPVTTRWDAVVRGQTDWTDAGYNGLQGCGAQSVALPHSQLCNERSSTQRMAVSMQDTFCVTLPCRRDWKLREWLSLWTRESSAGSWWRGAGIIPSLCGFLLLPALCSEPMKATLCVYHAASAFNTAGIASKETLTGK